MSNINRFEQAANERNAEKFSNVVAPIKEIDDEEESKSRFERFAKQNVEKKQNQFGFLDTLKDVGQQVIKKGISGIGGAYGNILEAFGGQLKEGETLPGQKAVNDTQFEILQKQNRGEPLSFSEIFYLSDDDTPNYSRLPTSSDIESGIEKVTGVGKGKTPSGRIAGRAAEFLGEGVATGGGGSAKVLAALGLSGLAGQGIREAGGPEALASGVEIGLPFTPSLISKALVPTVKSSKDIIQAGRKLGLTEAQITPLVQGEKKVATLAKLAEKGERTKNIFSSIKEKLGDVYGSLKNNPEAKKSLSNASQIDLRKKFGNIRNELSKTLAPSPDKKAALDFIENSLETLRNQNITPEYLINFWQDINKSVKWNSIQGGKKALAQLKEPISDILKKTSPGIANDFELTNKLYSKYAQISKKLKPDFIDSLLSKGEMYAVGPAGVALAYGNPWILTSLAGEKSLRLLGREMLINPYFQSLAQKLVVNFNQGSAKGVTEIVKQAKEYMERKHPNEKWEFLEVSNQE